MVKIEVVRCDQCDRTDDVKRHTCEVRSSPRGGAPVRWVADLCPYHSEKFVEAIEGHGFTKTRVGYERRGLDALTARIVREDDDN